MKKLLCFFAILAIITSLWGCSKPLPPAVTTSPTTEPTTEPVEDEMEHFDLNEIDLDAIGALLAERGQTDRCRIQLDGLYTPVVLELQGTDLVSISANGAQVSVDPEAWEYTGIYGNLWPVIYEHEGLIFLNIWHDDIGYSCVLCPDGTYLETFPDEEYSVMIYVDEVGRMVQSQFARHFIGIEQWDTGPIDMATSREDFYYSIDNASWANGVFNVTAGETYTISDCFDLEEIFDNAKEDGFYPEFETLDELLAYNAQRFGKEDPSGWPDSTREEVSYFDELRAAYDYDKQKNLICETFYTLAETAYFTKLHEYDRQNREISGTWLFQGEEAYRYTHTYDEKGRLTETVWYQAEKEVERFAYTYDANGGHTETFSQNGEKKYTYAFNEEGELTGHTVYQGGKAVKTKDIKNLVKTDLLTDLWLPIIDSDTRHDTYRYNGTVAMEAQKEGEVTTAADGSYVVRQEYVDVEDDEVYRHEYHYDANDRLLKAIHCSEGVEYLRDEYQYDSKGLCIQQVTYLGGEKDMTCIREYNRNGQLIRKAWEYTTPQSYYIYTDENGMPVDKEVTYTLKEEVYRYNKQGLLAETVTYEDGNEADRTVYHYDANGYVLPRLDTYQYVYSAEGVLEEIWLIYEDWSSGAALLRSRTVYVTPENARQLQEILHTELSWL